MSDYEIRDALVRAMDEIQKVSFSLKSAHDAEKIRELHAIEIRVRTLISDLDCGRWEGHSVTGNPPG